MSKYNVIYGPIHEIIVDKNDDFVKAYESRLPHADEIITNMCKDWNNMHIEKYFDGILKDKISSAIMKKHIEGDNLFGKVEITGMPNFRFTQKIKEEIADQMDGQFCDGWGESFFGSANIMTASDGTRFYAE